VLKHRKAGLSLRGIAAATGLTFSTVRTICDKDRGTDSASKRTNLLRRREFNRMRAAAFRARKKARDALPGKLDEWQKDAAKLLKEAKGLGGRR
jgi:hypothetical protein